METRLEPLDSLRKDLLAQLDKEDDVNFEKILSLANEIAKHDTEYVRFTVDASHISRLGYELVAKQETAVAELIKNAYDADATIVDVIFRNTSKLGGELEIIDNGTGMNYEQLVNGFMRISTDKKEKNPRSDIFKRQRAGRKGIGRFSAQRLGHQLTIITQRDELEYGLQISIDWGKFEQSNELILISNKVQKIPKTRTGTTIKISLLKDVWSDAQIQRTYRYILELSQPFPLGKIESETSQKDPGFKATFSQDIGNAIIPIASEEQNIFSHAVAVISGRIDDNGNTFYSIQSKQYKIYIQDKIFEIDHKIKTDFRESVDSYKNISGIIFQAHYFIADDLPPGSRNAVRNVLTNRGGIRIYRNGFRVLPYGESYDDWLSLQRSSALRKLLPPHHNTNFLGFVQINDITGHKFEETASREGLIEKDAFFELQDFTYRVLMNGVMAIANARARKVFASDPPKTKKVEQPSPTDIARDIVSNINQYVAPTTAAPSGSQDLFTPPSPQEKNTLPENIANDITAKILTLGEQTEAILEENGMLRVLASLGLTIGEFTHETRHVLAAVAATTESLATQLVGDKSVCQTLEDLRTNIKTLQAYLRYFDKAVADNSKRSMSTHELRDLINEFERMISYTVTRQHVNLTKDIRGYDLFVRPTHRSEWASIFLNLFSNSLKAIKRAGVKGEILIKAGDEDSNLFIEFSDNGDGISDENIEKIFEPFFTTSSPSHALANDEDQITGSGLGLKIIKDIIEAFNGEIYVTTPPEGYSTCFRIEIPKAKESEIPDELR